MIDAPATDVITLSLAASVDELSSAHALSRGGLEVGAIYDPGPRILAKAATITVTTLAANRLRRDGHPRWAKALRITVCAVWLGLGVKAQFSKGLR